MGQHKHNPTAIAAANGELPPKKRERRLTKRQAERLLRLKIIRTTDPDWPTQEERTRYFEGVDGV